MGQQAMTYIPEENKHEVLKLKNLIEKLSWGIEYSDFLSPFAIKYAVEVLLKNQNHILHRCWGGYEGSERNILAIFSSDFEEYAENLTYPIQTILIEAKNNLSHRQILGSLIGNGLKRDKIGDILVKENSALVFVKDEIATYIVTNIDKIGKEKVKCSIVENGQIDIKWFINNSSKRIVYTVASLRVDSVISHGFGISREEAADLIRQMKVAVNWVYIDKPSYAVKEGDLLSVRHHGRLKIEKVLSTTKKGRISIEVFRFS
ncbi:RNA-binding protein [Caldicellulosiruptor acetigenus]|uniref:YlmH family RNA-binding protein n=1 Tax=Caldicellulosiruptor acetigenus TaxID=301953 RepID=UPI00041BC69E|nr:YlmH/Sll1252 family protein [Caldicellulosiruptor acetigenus]WAM35064.1 YlmH/Sll1252 family protein [Caldicellulosiruptor acetigenus]